MWLVTIWWLFKAHDRGKSFFATFKEFNGDNVTFGDGSIGWSKRIDAICIFGCPKLSEVLYVERLNKVD